jgi:phenylacetate-CoA ligase
MIRILSSMRTYQRNQFLAPDELEKFQRRRLECLLRYARKRSPFLAEYYKHVPEENIKIEDIPPITKRQVMENFDDYCTDRRVKKAELGRFVRDPGNVGKKYRGYIAFHTSGTSGEAALIIYDKPCFDKVKALSLVRGMGQELSIGQVLRTLARPMRIAAVVMDGGLYPGYSNFAHTPVSTKLFAKMGVFSLRDPLPVLVGKLNAFEPDILIGYPSILQALAHEQLAGRLRILHRRAEHVTISISEPLSPDARRVIRGAFPCPLINLYGAGECMAIANSCVEGTGMHVNSDFAILEVVDRQGRKVEPGAIGHKVYLTNLENYVQPFIRYEVTDVVSWAEAPCPCGRSLPVIQDVSGRTDDIIYLAGERGGFQFLHPYWIMAPLLGCHDLKEWQVVQEERQRFTVSVVPMEGLAIDEAKIIESLDNSMAEAKVALMPEWHIERVERIAPDPVSGKVRRIWSKVEPPLHQDIR